MKNAHHSHMFKRPNTGFTLVEVIVVLVVIAVLAAIAIPAFTNWIDAANARKCMSQMGDVRRDYAAFAADAAYDVDDPAPLLASAVLEMTGQTASSNGFEDGMGGRCTATYAAENEAILDIYCSLHGSLERGGRLLGESAELGITALTTDRGEDKDKKKVQDDDGAADIIQDYIISRGLLTGTVDSQGKNYGLPASKALAKLGIPLDSGWCVSYSGNVKGGTVKADIYWTDTDITKVAPGTEVSYVKYSFTFTRGTSVSDPIGAFVRTSDPEETGKVKIVEGEMEGTKYRKLDVGKAVKDPVGP